MANNFTLLSIGDASLDTFIEPSEVDTTCEIDNKKCLISFTYGDKIPVKSLDYSVGGNAANNAVGASRLGVETAILLTIGQDNSGNQIYETLEKERVYTGFIKKDENTTSNSSIVIRYLGERTIFTYHSPKIYQFPVDVPIPQWIYLTSMGENFAEFYESVYELLAQNPNIKLGFNPGSWQLKAGIESLKNILSRTVCLFVNKEEAEKLTGIEKSENNHKSLLDGLSNLGVQIPIITDGGNGCFAKADGKYWKLGTLNIPVIERTGAGDAFGSGCLSALIKGKSLEEALVWGMCNSSSVISFIGSQKGLLHDSEIPSWLEKVRSSNIKVEEL
ncbi:MAG TPA: carbohydrate kinase family protein [Patescibacteria group bacterium]|nr:carbohydrate kinase family protein [Patescibacteria group bacterium]